MASITHQITGKLDGESVRRRFRDSPAGRDEAKSYAKTVTNPETRYIVRATVRGRKLSKTFTRKRDADAYITTLDHDRLRGVSVDPRLAREPFGEYADRWLAQRTDLAKRTHQSYFSLLKNTILPTFGSVALSAITVADVRAWSAKQRKAHPSTGAHAYRLLAKMMGDAVVDEILAASPCKVHRAGQEPPSVHATASVAELEALTAAMPEHLRLAVLLASWCQLRRGEVLGLRRRDVNLLQGTLSVDVTRGPGMDGLEIVKEPKSKAGRRTLAIPPNVLSVLEHHLDTFTPAGPDAWVLVDLNGDPLTATELYKPWCKARAAIGRQDLRFHDLRHTGLSLFAVQGATVAELMLRAGHASPAAAMRYQHATVDRDRFLAGALAELVKPAEIIPMKWDESETGTSQGPEGPWLEAAGKPVTWTSVSGGDGVEAMVWRRWCGGDGTMFEPLVAL